MANGLVPRDPFDSSLVAAQQIVNRVSGSRNLQIVREQGALALEAASIRAVLAHEGHRLSIETRNNILDRLDIFLRGEEERREAEGRGSWANDRYLQASDLIAGQQLATSHGFARLADQSIAAEAGANIIVPSPTERRGWFGR